MATAKKGTRKAGATDVAVTSGTEEVVVRGRPLATATPRRQKPLVIDPDSPLVESKDYKPIAVKVIGAKGGYYGHKRRKLGEVIPRFFVHKDIEELPSWVEYLSEVEKGENEGTRGLHFGTREDDIIAEERAEKRSGMTKGLKGGENVVDHTILEDSVPLTQNGNERRPAIGGGQSVI